MRNSNQVFRALHCGSEPLLLPNAWDAASAVLLQKAGAKAIGTSSAALAWSLGYADGGALPRDELLAAIARLMRVISVPLSVDIEAGYSDDPSKVAALASNLVEMGVAGVNLEDGAQPPALLAGKIAQVRNNARCDGLFINARTDVYLRRLAPKEGSVLMTLERAKLYKQAGADALFVPGLAQTQALASISKEAGLPLNLMALPNMPPIGELVEAGMRRLSLGPAIFNSAYGLASTRAAAFVSTGATDGLFADGVDYQSMNELMAGAK